MTGALILAACAIVAAVAVWFIYLDIFQPGGNTERGLLAVAFLIAAVIVALGPLFGDALTETFKPAR